MPSRSYTFRSPFSGFPGEHVSQWNLFATLANRNLRDCRLSEAFFTLTLQIVSGCRYIIAAFLYIDD